MAFTSNPRTLRDILSSGFFVIPRYQRPYSWTREEVDELWDDAIAEGASEYFIGSMVVYPEKKKGVRAVIDGQQRLTTLAMMLAAIRDEADSHDLEKLANGTHIFLERRDEDDDERSVLVGPSYPYLQDRVLSRGESELAPKGGREQTAIEDAFERVQELVRGALSPITTDTSLSARRRTTAVEKKLRAIRDALLDLQLIFVEVSNVDDATTIFVTLNARGRDLEPADLVKATLLAILPSSGAVDTPLQRWQEIVAKFDASSEPITMTSFLLASYRSRYGSTTAAGLSKAVKETLKRDKATARRYLKELEEDADLFRSLNEPGYRRWPNEAADIPLTLQFLRDENISQPMPMLLSLLRAYARGHLTLKMFRSGLRAIEDYYFAYTKLAGKSSSGGVSSTFYRRAQELLHSASSSDRARVVREMKTYLKGRRPTDEEFDEGFRQLWFTNEDASDKKRVQYVLRRLYVHENPKAATDFNLTTIEHLKPQEAGGENVGQIGNLILVSEDLNRKLGAKSFAAKLPILKAARGEWIPPDVLSERTWTDAKIDRRTTKLAAIAREKVWVG